MRCTYRPGDGLVALVNAAGMLSAAHVREVIRPATMGDSAMINLRSLDLNLLTVFEAIYEIGTVSGAGGRLALSKSATSHALSRLREACGDELFVRAGQGLAPTPIASAHVSCDQTGTGSLARKSDGSHRLRSLPIEPALSPQHPTSPGSVLRAGPARRLQRLSRLISS